MPQSGTVISETKLREQIVDCTRMMVMAELLDYSGHVSARLPGTDRFLIPARDASRAGIAADDILIVDLTARFSTATRRARPRRKSMPASIGRGTMSPSSATVIRRCRPCSRWSSGR